MQPDRSAVPCKPSFCFRSPSDQRPLTTSGYSSDQMTSRPTHSPIIMEGGSKKGSSSVRRNASFHALLPSRPPDSQPSPAPEVSVAGLCNSRQCIQGPSPVLPLFK